MSLAARVPSRLSALLLAIAATCAGAAHAEQRVIRIVVPYGTGAVQDTIARAIGDELGRTLDASIVIENRAGAGGTVGTAQVARAAPTAIRWCWPPPATTSPVICTRT